MYRSLYYDLVEFGVETILDVYSDTEEVFYFMFNVGQDHKTSPMPHSHYPQLKKCCPFEVEIYSMPNYLHKLNKNSECDHIDLLESALLELFIRNL